MSVGTVSGARARTHIHRSFKLSVVSLSFKGPQVGLSHVVYSLQVQEPAGLREGGHQWSGGVWQGAEGGHPEEEKDRPLKSGDKRRTNQER